MIGVGYSLSETDVAFLMITLKGDDYEAQKMIAQTETENPSFSTAYIKEWYDDISISLDASKTLAQIVLKRN